MEGWVDLSYLAMHRPGIELAISRSQVRHPNPGPSRATAGPGKTLSRGPITSPSKGPMLYVLRSRHRRHREGETWGEVSPHHPTRGSGSVVSSPSGRAENGFYAYFRSERSHLEHHFQYFWVTAGPPKRRGPGKTSPLSPVSTGLP